MLPHEGWLLMVVYPICLSLENGNMGTFLAPPAFLFSPEAREVEEHRETLYKTLSVVYAMPHLQNCGWHVPLRYRPSNMTRSALCECHNSLAKGQ